MALLNQEILLYIKNAVPAAMSKQKPEYNLFLEVSFHPSTFMLHKSIVNTIELWAKK